MNSSVVDYNRDNGVNITYEGGWRIFNRSSFSHNLGNGVNVTMNETRTLNNGTVRYARHQRTEVRLSVCLSVCASLAITLSTKLIHGVK